MRLWFVMGTAAELIKMFPVIDEARRRGTDWYLWSTGQGATNFWNQYDDFKLPRDRAFTFDDKAVDLHSSGQAMRWMARNIFTPPSRIRSIVKNKIGFAPAKGDLIFVHGDTFSTLLGAIQARLLGCRVVHVEAGMRSGSIWSPFPEEINRRIVSRLTHFHFAPDENAASHLREEKQKGVIVITGGNSVYDALLATLSQPRPTDLPQAPYIVANLHRFENLHTNEHWNTIVDTTIQAAKRFPVYFVMHPPTEAKINGDAVLKAKLENGNVRLLGRQSYTRFVHLLAGAHHVLTDGGSNQTECAYLGIPCLIMRSKTELPEGLDKNCVLSEFRQDRIQRFLGDPAAYQHPKERLEQSPSKLVFDHLPL
jgi:UDP-N-acetylglucosamine 2-epimerase (non-hydrolysing)